MVTRCLDLAKGAATLALGLALAVVISGAPARGQAAPKPTAEPKAKAKPKAAATAPAAPIDLNTASLADLETLPGIGPVLAKEIVAGRPYKTVDELARIKGLGKARLNGLRGLVTAKARRRPRPPPPVSTPRGPPPSPPRRRRPGPRRASGSTSTPRPRRSSTPCRASAP